MTQGTRIFPRVHTLPSTMTSLLWASTICHLHEWSAQILIGKVFVFSTCTVRSLEFGPGFRRSNVDGMWAPMIDVGHGATGTLAWRLLFDVHLFHALWARIPLIQAELVLLWQSGCALCSPGRGTKGLHAPTSRFEQEDGSRWTQSPHECIGLGCPAPCRQIWGTFLISIRFIPPLSTLQRARLPIMFGRGTEKQFLGLRGFHLNIAIGLIAGLDFLYRSSRSDPASITDHTAGFSAMISKFN
jgi:hypothetical protein